MAEYIEREALQEALQRKKAGVADRRYTEGWNDCLLRMKSMVHGAKAADVAPEVHGEWVGIHDGKGICSNCNRLDSIDPLATHCRYCGAKMNNAE